MFAAILLLLQVVGWVEGLVGNKDNLSPSSVGARIAAELGNTQIIDHPVNAYLLLIGGSFTEMQLFSTILIIGNCMLLHFVLIHIFSSKHINSHQFQFSCFFDLYVFNPV